MVECPSYQTLSIGVIQMDGQLMIVYTEVQNCRYIALNQNIILSLKNIR